MLGNCRTLVPEEASVEGHLEAPAPARTALRVAFDWHALSIAHQLAKRERDGGAAVFVANNIKL